MQDIEGPQRRLNRYTRNSVLILAHTFGINHACVTTPIQFQTTYLGQELGNIDNMLLYVTTMLTALFLGALLNDMLGARVGLTVSMAGYGVYVTLFSFALLMPTIPHTNPNGDIVQIAGTVGKLCGIIGSIIGGIAAGPLWTFQGVVVGKIVQDVAEAEQIEDTQPLSAELWSVFGLWFLGWEAVIRATTTLLTKYAGFSPAAVFFVFAALAFTSTAVFFFGTPAGADPPQESGKACGKTAAAVGMWSDPKIWLLQFTNLTFGFGAAWNASYVNSKFIGGNSALGPDFVGLLSAVISLVGGILSRVFGFLAPKIGKGPIIFIGAVAFLLIGTLSLLFQNGNSLGFAALVFPILMGTGRGVYESTNKGVFNDFYPKPETRAGVFANVMVFGTLSSAVVFLLGFINAGTDLAPEANPVIYLLIAFALGTGPALMTATFLKARQDKAMAVSEGENMLKN